MESVGTNSHHHEYANEPWHSIAFQRVAKLMLAPSSGAYKYIAPGHSNACGDRTAGNSVKTT